MDSIPLIQAPLLLPDQPQLRRCTRCGESKPVTEFHKQASLPNGLKRYCKACCREINAQRYIEKRSEIRQKQRFYYGQHSDEFKFRAKQQYQKDPEQWKRQVKEWQVANWNKRLRYSKTYYENHREAILERQHQDRQERPGAYRETEQRYRVSHPDVGREVVRRRRARLKGATAAVIPTVLLLAKMAYWGNRCWICGGPEEAVDHVKPLNKGGRHILANLRPICRSCNSRKGDRWPLELE